MAITVKRLDSEDIRSLAPVLLGLVLWLIYKGFRYVPR